MSQAKTGRYSVGQQIVGVAAIVADPGRNGTAARKTSLIAIPLLWQLQESGVKVTDFVFKVFTVCEHHRVPDEYDEKRELTYDGYILRMQDDKGAERVGYNQYPTALHGQLTWYNQYPTASHGQLTDISNMIFTLHVEGVTSEQINKLFGDWKNPWQFIAAERMLESITMPKHDVEKILKDLNSEHPRYNSAAVAHSQELYFQFMKAFERDVGERFKIIDKEVFPGYFAKRVVIK